MKKLSFWFGFAASAVFTASVVRADIPLPEHPRPDYERAAWQNLNGSWAFRFDKDSKGEAEKWFNPGVKFPLSITVPFGWGSPLSGVPNDADIGWYQRKIRVPADWKGKRVFLVIGACDFETKGWFDGKPVGSHRGGYTPFEFELTRLVKWGEEQTLAVRVYDMPKGQERIENHLYGKQGYGNVRGIWQTAYLEARSETYLEYVHFYPDIDNNQIRVHAKLNGPAKDTLDFSVAFKPEDRSGGAGTRIDPGEMDTDFVIPLENVKLWDLDNPYLYEVKVKLAGKDLADEVSTYFGMRKISVENLPGTDFPYIALNNKPHYMQLTLDQSYHPEGFYTFPTDEFMKNEILISKKIGLSGNRIHIKIEVPRKLYWADKLGLLIMADVPNSWGEPTPQSFQESAYALIQMIRRDMNHPSIFSWVLFNETWGLFTNTGSKNRHDRYLPETREKVAAIYRLAKMIDPTRIIEDQSACNQDHVISDLNSWHAYKPWYQWESTIAEYVKGNFPGSTHNYIGGYKQEEGVPMMNSECGNVWGYDGSTGDVDWSWDYHAMLDAFHRAPKCAGWLYTEHHDVTNEWNGYVRFDRSEKYTGIEQLFPGMSLKDLHGDVYLALDKQPCTAFAPGATYNVPMTLSIMTDKYAGKTLRLSVSVRSWDAFGKLVESDAGTRDIPTVTYQQGALEPFAVKLPTVPAAGVICFALSDGDQIVGRNFTTFVTRKEGGSSRDETVAGARILRVAPKAFARQEWSQKQWNVMDGLKVNGAGKGFFEYEIPWPQGLKASSLKNATFLAEISAKRLNGKDRAEKKKDESDYMLGRGNFDPSWNQNSYPMTGSHPWKGAVTIGVNGETITTVELPDDPADHRGILSWFAQKQDRHLHEAGSYGYPVEVSIPAAALAKAEKEGKLVIRLGADAHGLALYGESFGRYPMDLTLKLQ